MAELMQSIGRYWTRRAPSYTDVIKKNLADGWDKVWADELTAHFPRDTRRVLDIGTGSGILAIAALKLGAASAEGVDIDPVAVRTAGENAALNGVQDKLTVLVGDLSDKASGTYDIITANIVANAILSLAPAVPGLMAEGATFIASGIIDSRKDEVIAGLKKAGLAVAEVKEKRGWECIICKKA